jgi:signal transduction histidine kinase
MLLLLVIAVAALTYASIRSIITANREVELDRVQRLVELMSTERFPLTSSVLENMKLLSEAELAIADQQGKLIAFTSEAPSTLPEIDLPESNDTKQTEPKTIEIKGKTFFHTAVSGIGDRNRKSNNDVLHIFVPSQSEQAIWWQASKSPMTIAALVLPLALILSLALANQVTRPLAKLNNQVQRIAEGEVQQIPEVRRNDEIHDLNVSINEMAVKLQDHEAQLLKNERLRTMVQLGSGIAHHLRNSATGCKMAVELLAVEKQGIAGSENYQVAIRQLTLMDNYIKKLLLLSKSPSPQDAVEIGELNLAEVLENVVFLLSPSAEHLGVELSVQSNCDNSKIRMSEEDGQQLMMNLISNAIRAASNQTSSTKHGTVSVELSVNQHAVKFSVTDNGSGPPEKIADTIFEPFVTGSKEGMGLGLSLVHEISTRAGGRVDWDREDDLTTFRFGMESQQNTGTE